MMAKMMVGLAKTEDVIIFSRLDSGSITSEAL